MTVSTFQNGSYLNGGFSTGAGTSFTGVTGPSLLNPDYLKRKFEYNDLRDGLETCYEGKNAVLSDKISNLCTYIEEGREDKAMKAYQELLAEISGQERYSESIANDAQLKAIARQMIETQLGGSLEDYIKDNTANSFQRGFEINWDGDKYQEEDLLEEMCDLDEKGRFDTVEKAIGGVANVGVKTGVGAAIGAVVGGLIGGIPTGGVGAAAGAIIGAKVGAGIGAAIGAVTKFLGF